MYDGDSFFTLTLAQRVGLVLISCALGAAMLLAVWRMCRRRSLPVRLAVGSVAFAVFLWVVPQFHYAYYREIIDGLPLQWVIRPWPDPAYALRVLIFLERPTIAHHALAALGWGGLVVACAAPLINLNFIRRYYLDALRQKISSSRRDK